MGFEDFLQAAIGVIIVIILVVIFAPTLIQISEITNTEAWGYFGAGLMVVFAIIVVIGTILKLSE